MSVKIRNIEVDKLIGESSKFRVYLGQTSDAQQTIVKISKTFGDNSVLAEDAKVLNKLKSVDADIAKMCSKDSAGPNYYKLFARLMSSFIERSQDDRRVNVYTIPSADFDDITPLPKLVSSVEIDTRSSVWILGRFFKFYNLFEIIQQLNKDDGCRYPLFSPNDYLISPKLHRLVYYNFSGEVYDIDATEFVKEVSQYILDWTVFSDTEEDVKYRELVETLSKEGESTFGYAHKKFYDMIKEVWGIKYYPFTYRHRGTIVWKNIEEERNHGV